MHVRRGIEWLVARQRADGGLLGSKEDLARRHFYQQFMYEHGIATFALNLFGRHVIRRAH